MVVARMTSKGKAHSTDVSVNRSDLTAPPESSDEIQTYTWSPRAEVVCQSQNGTRKYLRQESMREFLGQLHDNQVFRFRGLKTSDHFSSSEFYLILNWMRDRNLVQKSPGGYVIKSIEMVRRAWNTEVSQSVQI